MAEETPEGYESPRERRERIRERREAMAAANGNPTGTDDGRDPNERYNIAAIEKRRQEMGEKIWRAVAEGRLNLSNERQLGEFLTSIGLLDQKEEGRHMRRMFLGWLGDEGWGRNEQGYGKAIDEYKPNWRRMVEGMQRGADGLYFTDGGRYYDAFGRLVRTSTPTPPAPVNPTAPPVPTGPTPPPSSTTSPTQTTSPNADTAPTPNPAFYGGATPPNPYGVSQSVGMRPIRPRIGQQNTKQTPGWYPTWRF